MSDPHWLTAAEIGAAYTARRMSPVELVQALLDRIETHDGRINAFIKVDAEGALGIAEALKQPDVAKRLVDMSMEETGSELAQFMRQERERWGNVIRASGAKAD